MKLHFISLLLLIFAIAGCKNQVRYHALFFNVRDFGAKGDGVTKDTVAFQKAFDACAAFGGGPVLVPPGKYVIGSVQMSSQTMLWLQKGSIIIGSGDMYDFRVVWWGGEGTRETGPSRTYLCDECGLRQHRWPRHN